ncbi:hypothetical protein [Pseudobdellovibrio exovorus]|uniref:Lipoprotein n=1 Tax=Pseudobdellovibrio exovorus JSS TaxID=1184267 RepID=M4V7T4_9BACT|nr:hypothetical protein [Pseudobdellovibrio exovorus]AGH94475.1 hypothetical protein A11Q_255 [Pseudobdellovibrio exovorus JSS]
MIFSKKSVLKYTVGAIIAASLTGCSALLMLPDELSEDHYKSISKIDQKQVASKMQYFPGGKLSPPAAGQKKMLRFMPFVYTYDATNTLKKDEEAYYVSIFNNSSGSWYQQLLMRAHESVAAQLEKRGYDYAVFSNNTLKNQGAQEVTRSLPMDRKDGLPNRGIAINAESNESNLAIMETSKYSNLKAEGEQGVVYMQIDADWEPESANRLNGDIVLNTTVKIGFKLSICGDTGCSTAVIPFKNGVTAALFMPNRNTIDDDGLDKNYALIRDLHEAQLDVIIAEAFKRFDQAGVFVK